MTSPKINLEGPKVRLRDWTLADVEPFRAWQKPGQMWQALDGPYYQSAIDESEKLAQELKGRIERFDFPNPRMRLPIATLANDKLIGTVSSYWQSIETNWLSIGIIIYDAENWGRGIGFEAMKLWMDYLFTSYPEIARLDMRTWSGNQGLVHLAQKLGFKQEACFRKARFVEGKYHDGLGYGILREEWDL